MRQVDAGPAIASLPSKALTHMNFQHSGHLIRVALVFAAGFVLFFVVRGSVVPKSFGKYGHYRADALGEIMARPASFGGSDSCSTCHEDAFTQRKTGKHANLNCEACHGPLARHADDPASQKPAKLQAAVLCARCHEANSAKPKAFPQVVLKEHSPDGACDACHQPHHPD